MRLGGPLYTKDKSPEGWVNAVQAKGYRAAFCPVGPGASDEEIQTYRDVARENDIVIAEVGAWSNPLSPDDKTRSEALEKCKAGLALADRIGARCCVNIAGSRGEKWDGPCKDDLTPETFEMIVETVRDIIDSVQPKSAFYTLETMPWMYPDSVEAYRELIGAIDRKQFAVHLDPVNLVCSPQLYFRNEKLLEECFEKLGPSIKSCHAKDIRLENNLTTHLNEAGPGKGSLDYAVYLRGLQKLDPDIPLMMEHLKTEEEYDDAAAYIRSVADKEGIKL